MGVLTRLTDWMNGQETQTAVVAVQPHLIQNTRPIYMIVDPSPVVALPSHAQFTEMLTSAKVGSWVPDNGVYITGIPLPQVVSGGTAAIRDNNAPDGGC